MRQIMILCMAHYQWVYEKITEPSDKPVIDFESETYAGADVSRFHSFSKWHIVKNRSILKQSVGCSGPSEVLAAYLRTI